MQLVNGQPGAQVPVLDRGVLYGHGVFETVLVLKRRPRLWERHLERLTSGCLHLGLPLDIEALEREAMQICARFEQDDFILRINQTMGEGGRGYANPEAPVGTRILTTHNIPSHAPTLWRDGIELGLCELRLSHQPALAGIKHNNRLEQILARASWRSEWHEALLMDHDDWVIEGTQSNVFAVLSDGRIITPDLANCGVAGVMRDYLLNEVTVQLGYNTEIGELDLATVRHADELFVSNSVIGVWPVKKFGDKRYNKHRATQKILSFMVDHEVIPSH